MTTIERAIARVSLAPMGGQRKKLDPGASYIVVSCMVTSGAAVVTMSIHAPPGVCELIERAAARCGVPREHAWKVIIFRGLDRVIATGEQPWRPGWYKGRLRRVIVRVPALLHAQVSAWRARDRVTGQSIYRELLRIGLAELGELAPERHPFGVPGVSAIRAYTGRRSRKKQLTLPALDEARLDDKSRATLDVASEPETEGRTG